MLNIVDCIILDHDLWLVALAGIVCVLASHTAFSLLNRAYLTRQMPQAWLMGSAVAMGSGVWATHFIAMLAFRTPWPVGYDVQLTTASALLSVAVSAIGLTLVHSGCRLTGGIVNGLAICGMHFVGMMALHGNFQLEWSASYVIASLAAGVGLTTLAFTVSPLPVSGPRRACVVGLYVAAVCGLHFTAMTAATLDFDPLIVPGGSVSEPNRQAIAIAVAAVTALLLSAGLLCALADSYLADRNTREAERLRHYVTELEATQAELRATTDNLSIALEAAAASSQAKSQFLTIMSHELRTPLNAVIGFSELVQMELHGPLGHPQYREYLEDIRSSGSHLLNLINDILDFSRIDAGKLELANTSVDLVELLDESIRLIAPQATGAMVGIHSNLPSQPVFVRGDRRRLMQIALNLLSNAVKFTPRGGRVEIDLQIDDDSVAFAVSDTGIGMTSEQIPVALEAFGQIDSSLSRNHEGTGLGLPLSQSLAQLHGGSLEIASEPSEGTTVTIRLPRHEAAASEAA